METRTQGSRPRPRTQKISRPRPRTDLLETKAKDQGHRRKCSPKKKVFKNFFQAISKKRSSKIFSGEKGLQKFSFSQFPLEENKKRSSQIFYEVCSAFQQNFNGSKNCAVLEPMTGQFSRTSGFEAKAKDFKICPRGRPRGQDVLEDSTSGFEFL